jgi:hypothetical protein
MDIHTGLHPAAKAATSGIWQIATMPSVYHIPGKFDGKTGTLSAMRDVMMAIEAAKVNNGGSLVDRNFLSKTADCRFPKNWYYS